MLAISMTVCKDMNNLTNQELRTINLMWQDILKKNRTRKKKPNKKTPQTSKTFFFSLIGLYHGKSDYLYGKGLRLLSTNADIPDSSGIIPAVSQQNYSISGVHQIPNHCSGKRIIRSLFCFCCLSGSIISVWEWFPIHKLKNIYFALCNSL